MVLNFTLFHDRTQFYDEYMYRNAEGRLLSGNSQIIFVELSKLDEVEKKPISQMTGMEKWALFLKYGNNDKKKVLINSILESEEGIRMGAVALEAISKDRDEWIVYYHQLKYEIDQESQILYALDKGKNEGKVEAAINIIKEFKVTMTKAMQVVDLPDTLKDMLLSELKKQNIEFSE